MSASEGRDGNNRNNANQTGSANTSGQRSGVSATTPTNAPQINRVVANGQQPQPQTPRVDPNIQLPPQPPAAHQNLVVGPNVPMEAIPQVPQLAVIDGLPRAPNLPKMLTNNKQIARIRRLNDGNYCEGVPSAEEFAEQLSRNIEPPLPALDDLLARGTRDRIQQVIACLGDLFCDLWNYVNPQRKRMHRGPQGNLHANPHMATINVHIVYGQMHRIHRLATRLLDQLNDMIEQQPQR